MTDQGVPPSIDGYAYERWLGGGGFADVFLYRQQLPERRVAIKVLRATVDDEGARGLFVAEANLMAKVSAHPNIVSIHAAGVSLDRRPYLVMEFYPLDHYGKRIEVGPLPYRQVLEVGIKIAGAVEAAHQARVVHRDIKPANILASDYGEPALTDFGISAAQSDSHTEESLGFSPPYAPKEILQNTLPGDARSDVYSLAATLWAMLAGHSPFERPGMRNSKSEIIARGINDPVPALPPGAAPAALETVLRQGLEKDPGRRPPTARALGQALQSIQRELGLGETELRLLKDRPDIDTAVAEVVAAVERTKQGRGVVVDLAGTTAPGSTRKRGDGVTRDGPSGSGSITPGPARQAGSSAPGSSAPPATARRAPIQPAPVQQPAAPLHEEEAPPRSSSRWPWLAGGIAAALIAGVVIAVALGGGRGERPATVTAAPVVGEVVNPGLESEFSLGQVQEVTANRSDGVVEFGWEPVPRDGVDYIVQRVDAGSSDAVVVTKPTFVVEDLDTDEVPCITVTARLEGVALSEPTSPVCAPG